MQTTSNFYYGSRLDYNPLVTVTPSRNMLPYSNTFSNAVWGKERGTISTDAIINGTQFSKFTEDTSTGIHRLNIIQPNVNWVTGSHTLTVEAKPVGSRYLYINAASTLGAAAVFDLNAGTYSVASGTATIVAMPNGVYRCSVTGTYGSF